MPGSLTSWPVVGSGSNGHPVKTLQFLLRARGHTVAVASMGSIARTYTAPGLGNIHVTSLLEYSFGCIQAFAIVWTFTSSRLGRPT